MNKQTNIYIYIERERPYNNYNRVWGIFYYHDIGTILIRGA